MKRYNLIMLSLILTCVIVGIVILTNNQLNYLKYQKALSTKQINGLITTINHRSRGEAYIEVLSGTEVFNIYGYAISSDLKERNVQVGDSVSKNSNVRELIFYKKHQGLCEKCFVLDV